MPRKARTGGPTVRSGTRSRTLKPRRSARVCSSVPRLHTTTSSADSLRPQPTGSWCSMTASTSGTRA
eukprot:11128409-Lingulodinium_polyedra.AAC.1